MWSFPYRQYNADFWTTGDVHFSRDVPFGVPVNLDFDGIYLCVKLDPKGFHQVSHSAKPPALDEAKSTRKGGRPAGKNGEPIARLTKHLLSLSESDLANYTVEAATADLIEHYRGLGLQPPSPDNANRDAAGVLRTVRN